jgi:hypothetical protein
VSEAKARKTALVRLAKKLVEEIKQDLEQASKGPWERTLTLRLITDEDHPGELQMILETQRGQVPKTVIQAAQRLLKQLQGVRPIKPLSSRRKPFWSLSGPSKAPSTKPL